MWLWLVLLITCMGMHVGHAQVIPVEVVPSGTIQEVEGRSYFFHHVKQGQTLYSISRAYAVSQEVIVAENPDVAFGLRYDQVIRIPAFLYQVAPQETEFGLSRSFGITIDQLRAFNPAIAEGGLRAGMQIAIPGYKTAEVQKAVQAEPEPYIYIPKDPVPREQVAEILPCDHATPAGRYRVALLIPLFLDEATPYMRERGDPMDRDGRIPANHRSFSFLPYYQGVLLALDSIRKTGVDIRMEVIDVGQDMAGARTLVMREDFKDLDLIIGPFFPNTLDYIAGHASQHQIPVVSPLLADNARLRGAPYIFQATPSLEAQLASLAKYIAGHYHGKNILLVHNNQPGAMPMINAFKRSLGREMHMVRHFSDSVNLARVNGYFAGETMVGGRMTNVMIMGDSLGPEPGAHRRSVPDDAISAFPNFQEVIYLRTGMDGLVSKLRSDQKNIVITLVSGEAFLSNYLRELSIRTRRMDVAVFGIPEWQDYQSIEIDYLQSVKVHIFTPDYYDYTDPHIRDFVLAFRKAFNTEPGTYAFKGVQTAYFFFSALSHFGKAFPNCLDQINALGFDSPYRFVRTHGEASGWENQHSTLFRYQSFRKLDVRRTYETLVEEGVSEDQSLLFPDTFPGQR